MGELPLRDLILSSNVLSSLPLSFGGLTELLRLDIESNEFAESELLWSVVFGNAFILSLVDACSSLAGFLAATSHYAKLGGKSFINAATRPSLHAFSLSAHCHSEPLLSHVAACFA